MTKKIVLFIMVLVFLTSCQAFKPKKVDTRETPISGTDRARKNIEEGRGVSIGGIIGGRGGNFEFSSSNPMWRASLEVLDFIPLTTVDYSGGMIITDWYSDGSTKNREALKISVRFLSNELRSDSIKILVHKKNCNISENCGVNLLPQDSKINSELLSVILRKAATMQEDSKKKPVKK